MSRFILPALTALLLLSPTAQAQDVNDSFMSRIPPEGSVILNLSASEELELTQDELVASLRYEVTGDNAKDVQSEINGKIQEGLKAGKAVESVKVSTGGYNVWQNYRPRPTENGKDDEAEEAEWRGQQTISLEGKNAEEFLKLVTDLQGMGFLNSNLSYTLSSEKQKEVQDELMTMALKKLQERAKVAADALGKSTTQFIEINADNSGNPGPMPMMRAEMAQMDGGAMNKASAEPGETTVSMTVSARILLKP